MAQLAMRCMSFETIDRKVGRPDSPVGLGGVERPESAFRAFRRGTGVSRLPTRWLIEKAYVRLSACFVFATLVLHSVAAVPLPELTVPNGFGVNIHFRGEPRDLDLIADAGFKFIRMDLTWEAIEREKGTYEFENSGYDALTKACAKRGIRLLYILDYSNRLYESDRSVRTRRGREAFADFAEAAASRYAGQGILWEIWNEPNIEQFWRPQPSAEDYCDLVEATAPHVREADRTGLVVAPATSQIPFEWLEACFKRGLLKWIDALTVHPYRSQPPETVVEHYARLRCLIQKYAPKGKEIPILSGEWGYSLIEWNKARLSQEQQARYLVRMFLVNLYQDVPVSIWYDWKDDGTDPNEREHHFGTMTHDLKLKAAYRAARTLAHTLEGYSVEKRLDLCNENDFVLKLRKDQNEALAIWTVGEQHDVQLPIGPGSATLIDMLGEKRALSWEGDELRLGISQSPQYLLIKGE